MTFLNFETGENLCSINISFTHVDNNDYQLSYRLRFADGDIAQSCLNEILTNNNLRIHNEINSFYDPYGCEKRRALDLMRAIPNPQPWIQELIKNLEEEMSFE